MTVTIKLPDQVAATLESCARSRGLTLAEMIETLAAETELAPRSATDESPFETGYGMWARHDAQPVTNADIEDARREMWGRFPVG